MKTIPTVLAVAALTLIGGAAIYTTTPPHHTDTTTAVTAYIATPTAPLDHALDRGIARNAYLDTITAHLPHATTAQLLDYGHVACQALASTGDTLGSSITVAQARRLSPVQAAATVGAVRGSGLCRTLTEQELTHG